MLNGCLVSLSFLYLFSRKYMKYRHFDKALNSTNLKLRPLIFVKLFSCFFFVECLLQFNRGNIYNTVDLTEILKNEIKTGKFNNPLYEEQIRNKHNGDYIQWYQVKVMDEIKYLSLAYIYSDSILEYNVDKNLNKQIKLANDQNTDIHWVKKKEILNKYDNIHIDKDNFKFDTKSTEGIKENEFLYLWHKYNQSLN